MLHPSDLAGLTDAQILELRGSRPRLSEEFNVFGDNNISRITDGTVLKGDQDFEDDTDDDPSEALTLDLVFHHTTIPVPRVRRIIRTGIINKIVMDYIPGRQLSQVWPTMSIVAKLHVAFVLRSYIRQLRAIRHPRSAVPGPVASDDHARVCYSPLFGQICPMRGPFTSYHELSIFFNDRQRRSLMPDADPAEAAARLKPFDDSAPLVLTHQDINMRNILVSDDGRLWLIDWAWAGFYPPWFEFIAMKIQSDNEEIVTKKKEPLWDMLIPFICGPYFYQERWFDRMRGH
ncbi:hypothetical protein A0H81_01008 [Grifola frondosa]|uniref:Aminoglycoside phosphotransferase domain-containing protein n=1 Tax=Grifola frondosa TaxID=5627 RepID=A0A1C7MQC9_GRIFR|nr:hypothetical protein A0H81_01008 [Grifola frondosa]